MCMAMNWISRRDLTFELSGGEAVRLSEWLGVWWQEESNLEILDD